MTKWRFIHLLNASTKWRGIQPFNSIKKEVYDKLKQLYLLTVIFSNALLLFLLDHNQNGVCNHNLCSIQDLMCLDKPYVTKFKRVCADFPNLALPVKITTPGNIQVTFGHMFVGNKSLRETITPFYLARSLESPMMVSIDTKRTFAIAIVIYSEKNHLPVTEVLFCAFFGEIVRSKKLKYWASLNNVLLPPFFTDSIDLSIQTSAAEILNIFSSKISDHRLETSSNTLERECKDEDKS